MGSSIDELLLRWRDLIVRVWIMDGSYLSDGFRDVLGAISKGIVGVGGQDCSVVLTAERQYAGKGHG